MPRSKALEAEAASKRQGLLGKGRALARILGPGLITGVSDDDPSGIGTYAQSGAKLGYAPLWLALYTLPFMICVQEMCARIAMQTGAGLAETIRVSQPRPVLIGCVGLLLVANTVNIGADLGAMAAAGQMLVRGPFWLWLVLITALVTAAVIWLSYRRYAAILRYLCLSLFAYVLVVAAVHQDWPAALHSLLLPGLAGNRDEILNVVAILGTTISPYLFFWQASQEVEDMIDEGKTTPGSRRGVSAIELKWRRADVSSGMIASNLVMACIIMTTASTLHRAGATSIASATQAAEALRPVAGRFAALVFALGILGTGLLAVPVLAGSSAYAAAETFSLREGLSKRLRQAPGFYAILAVSMLAGAAMNLAGIDPMKALYDSAILNGVAAPPLLFMILRVGGNRRIMKDKVNGPLSATLGWSTMVAMSGACLALLASLLWRS